jgi:hypothetical protein
MFAQSFFFFVCVCVLLAGRGDGDVRGHLHTDGVGDTRGTCVRACHAKVHDLAIRMFKWDRSVVVVVACWSQQELRSSHSHCVRSLTRCASMLVRTADSCPADIALRTKPAVQARLLRHRHESVGALDDVACAATLAM